MISGSRHSPLVLSLPHHAFFFSSSPILLLISSSLISSQYFPFPSSHLLCLWLIKISKVQMASGWLLSGNLPLIITGGDARGNVVGTETNGKLDFFHWIRVRSGDPYIDKTSTGRRSGEVLQTCRRMRQQTASDALWHLDTLPAVTTGLQGWSNPPSSPGPGYAGWRVKRPQS